MADFLREVSHFSFRCGVLGILVRSRGRRGGGGGGGGGEAPRGGGGGGGGLRVPRPGRSGTSGLIPRLATGRSGACGRCGTPEAVVVPNPGGVAERVRCSKSTSVSAR